MTYCKRKSKTSYNRIERETVEATLFGVSRYFTVYASSRYSNRCSATGKQINRGEPIACYEDGGKKYYTCWPLPETTLASKEDQFVDFVPSKYNLAIVDAIKNTNKHLLIDAAAGSGKTTSAVWSFYECMERLGYSAFIAFGRKDADRLKSKLPSNIESCTTHSLGAGIICRNLDKPKYNKNKESDLIAAACDAGDRTLCENTKDLLGKCKADAIFPGDIKGIIATAAAYEIDVTDNRVVTSCNKCLELSLDIKTYGFDYNDMLWLPLVKNWSVPKYNFIGIDEVQDFNECQLQLVKKFIENGARIFAVGDPDQALYLFRGARADSFIRIRQLLESTDVGIVDLSLPISYRNSQAVVNYAQQIVGNKIQARKGAPKGNVTKSQGIADMFESMRGGDMILCRVNAPLILLAYRFIDIGQPFHLLGGQEDAALLCWMIRKQTDDGRMQDLDRMIQSFETYFAAKKAEWSPYAFDQWYSRFEVIKLISNRVMSVNELIKEIRNLFNQPFTDDCIILSTIHRAKGSEANNVYLIQPQLLPHPKATKEEEKRQERNAQYVAVTRSKLDYHEIQGDIMEYFGKGKTESSGNE